MESISETNETYNVKMYKINSTEDFNSLYEKDNGINVLIFSAKWCGPCKRLKPQLMELIVKLRKDDKIMKAIKFYYIDVDKCLSLSEHHKISTVPTIIVLNKSIEEYRTNEIDNIDEVLLELSMTIV